VGTLMIFLEPDELQGLHAITEMESAAGSGEADLAVTAKTLLRGAVDARLTELGLRWNPSSEAIGRRAAQAARQGGPAALLKSDRTRRYVTSGLAVAGLVVLWGGYARGWQWTGFQDNNQLWDWLHLLLLPVVVGTIPLWIQHPEYLHPTRRRMHLVVVAAFLGLVIAGYLVPLNWTGFRGNTLWNWLGLVLLPAAVASARFLPTLARSLRPHHKVGIAAAGLAWGVTIIGGYAWRWTWTGYQGNTLWDWLALLLLPLLVPAVLLPAVLRRASATAPAAHKLGKRAQPQPGRERIVAPRR
jgi:hypothetical protein